MAKKPMPETGELLPGNCDRKATTGEQQLRTAAGKLQLEH